MPVESELSRRALTPSGDPIMAAKLRPPPAPPWTVARQRLFERLSLGAEGPLTLVSAPAGSGKTVLVGSWAAARRSRGGVAWVSLDEQDTRSGVLWSYVLAGLGSAGVPVAPVGSPSRPDGCDHGLLTRLAACLSDLPHPVVLVLDNAQHLTGPDGPGGVDFLLRHAAPQLRLVLVGRFDPELPLHRYRVAGSVTELRFGDLAFTHQETAALFTAHGAHLSAPAAAAVGRRTMGWAAGVRLAAMALQHRPERAVPDGDATADGGDIADYFVAEVLDAQPPDVRDLLLRTSIVDRLWPGLAAELSGRGDAQRTLALLTHTDSFIAPALTEQEGYEYHPTVRELLRAQLRREAPQAVGQLHRKAAGWLAGAGRVTDAVVHACAGGDWEQAVGMLVDAHAVAGMLAGPDAARLTEAFAPLPGQIPGPRAAVVHALLALHRHQLDTCAGHLLAAEEQVVRLTEPDRHAVRLAAAVTELAHCRLKGEAAGAITAAARAEELVERLSARGTAVPAALPALIFAGRGAALLHLGDVRGAAEATASGLAAARRTPGQQHLVAACLGQLALVEAVHGHLRRAAELARKAGSAANRCGWPATGPGASAELAMAWIHAEGYDPATARTHIDRAAAAPEVYRDPVTAGLLALVRARTQRARGDIGGAVATIDRVRATPTAGQTPAWLADRLGAIRTALRAASGAAGLPAGPVPASGAPHSPASATALAMASLAAGRCAEATALLAPVLEAPGLPTDIKIEALLLSAGCELARGCTEPARSALARALRAAAPERMRRQVFEASPAVRRLLRQSPDLAEQHTWLGSPAAEPQLTCRATGEATQALLVETLTGKETEVLRYLAAMLSTEEIARTMFVSVNTVKTHIRGVLRKLAAVRRNEAVRRARELGLV